MPSGKPLGVACYEEALRAKGDASYGVARIVFDHVEKLIRACSREGVLRRNVGLALRGRKLLFVDRDEKAPDTYSLTVPESVSDLRAVVDHLCDMLKEESISTFVGKEGDNVGMVIKWDQRETE